MNRTRRISAELSVALALAALLIARTAAQDVSPEAETRPQAEGALEEVVVRGRPLSAIEFDLRTYIRDFVEEVAAPARSRGYARWQRGVCIGVHNLSQLSTLSIVSRVLR